MMLQLTKDINQAQVDVEGDDLTFVDQVHVPLLAKREGVRVSIKSK